MFLLFSRYNDTRIKLGGAEGRGVVEGNQKEHIMEGGRSKREENNHAKKKKNIL